MVNKIIICSLLLLSMRCNNMNDKTSIHSVYIYSGVYFQLAKELANENISEINNLVIRG